MHIERSEIRPGTESGVLVLYSSRIPRLRREGGVFPGACLDAGLLIGRDHELVGPKPAALPFALVQIQDASRLDFEVGVAREDPATMLPGSDCIFVEPPPDGGVTDRGDETRGADLLSEFGNAPA